MYDAIDKKQLHPVHYISACSGIVQNKPYALTLALPTYLPPHSAVLSFYFLDNLLTSRSAIFFEFCGLYVAKSIMLGMSSYPDFRLTPLLHLRETDVSQTSRCGFTISRCRYKVEKLHSTTCTSCVTSSVLLSNLDVVPEDTYEYITNRFAASHQPSNLNRRPLSLSTLPGGIHLRSSAQFGRITTSSASKIFPYALLEHTLRPSIAPCPLVSVAH